MQNQHHLSTQLVPHGQQARRLSKYIDGLYSKTWAERLQDSVAIALIEGLLYLGQFVIIYGEAGIGKTDLLLRLMQAVAKGQEFHGLTTKKGRAMHIDYELGPAGIARYAMRIGLADDLDVVYNVPAEYLKALILLAVEQHGVTLVGIDSITPLFGQSGIDNAMNSATAVERVLRPLLEAAHEANVTVVALHHTNKQGQPFDGSQRIRSIADEMYALRLNKKTGQFTLTPSKHRMPVQEMIWFATDHPAVQKTNQVFPVQTVESQTMPPACVWVLEALTANPDGMALSRLKDEFESQNLGCGRTLRRALAELRRRGLTLDRKVGKHIFLQLKHPDHLIGDTGHPPLTIPPMSSVPYAVSDEGQPMQA